MTDIVLILLLGVSAGILARNIGQSAAVAQVLVSIIIGPPLLEGHFSHYVLVALMLMAITAALLGPALMSLMILRHSVYKEACDGLYK